MNKVTLAAAATALIISMQTVRADVKPMITVYELQKEITAKNITLESIYCNVNLVAAEGSTSQFEGIFLAQAENEAYAINIEESGDAATVTFTVPTGSNAAFSGEFTLAVASGTTVTVNGKSGTVNVSGTKDASIKIVTSNGKVTAENCDGTLDITTKSGTITSTNITGTFTTDSSTGAQTHTNTSGTLSYETNEGALIVTQASGTISGTTIAGTQTYSDIEGTLNVKGSTGAVKISNATGVFNIKTNSASVNLFETKGEFHIETTKGPIVGNKGITLTASSDYTTTEGKIQIKFTNTLDELTFALTSDNSSATMIAKGTNKKKKLNLGKGPIVVTGHTTTGGQVYQ